MPDIKYFSNIWGASRGHLVVSNKVKGEPLVLIAPDQKQAELLYNEINFFKKDNIPVVIFSEFSQEPFEELRVDPQISAMRSTAMKTVLEASDYILISTPYAMLKKLPPEDVFASSIRTVRKGEIIPPDEMRDLLDRLGYLPVEVTTGPGEYCFRGGIVDIYPLGAVHPVRIEYFDDELDYIFYYDIQNQRKLTETESVELLPVSEVLFTTAELLEKPLPAPILEKVENFGKYAGHHWLVPLVYDNPATLADYTAGSGLIIFSDDWKSIFERIYVSVGDDKYGAFIKPPVFNAFLSASGFSVYCDISSVENAVTAGYRSVKPLFAFERKNIYHALSGTLRVIKQLHEEGAVTVIAMESERFISLLRDFCRDHEINIAEIRSAHEAVSPGLLYLYTTRVSGGFINEKTHFVMMTDEEIFGFVRKKNRPKPKDAFSTALTDLSEGDYVVHIDYGIGVYRGLRHMTMGGLEGDYLEILYENNELLFVPLEQITQIQKYIGIGDAKPRIASLHSTNWSKLKASARKHAAKIAQDLLKLYAERKARKGFAFIDNGELLSEFEECFEYDETEDQLTAIMDVYRDMESETPMERLVCGDVGFGKTEVAMRAAFKAVIAGKQVAVLVPTTVLARQHYMTFSKRFQDFPVKIDYISRFRTNDEVRKIRQRMEDGSIDIVIGTHRLLSSDIRFKDLCLLIIDEEQRFGVAHKEKISAMRSNIDVLSLSATPIPRTLQLSLSGIRDMSIIETPPANRQSIAIKVIQHRDDIKSAIITELDRGGQVFFLHNRIKDIEESAAMIREMIPSAAISIAHGQTPSKDLDKILKEFYDGTTNILISTSIIENGIDIPNVNAILIDDAANFGLSQLYQLKGRVGRSSRRGYCYLIVKNFKTLTPVARKRLSIIQQLSDLGSGIKIATYDLQLRGAGDILGAAQSGFLVKVGYELFIKMISEAVEELQDIHAKTVSTEITTQFTHYISADYIEDPRVRLEFYREFANVTDREMMNSLFEELSGQYGELKEETVNLGYIMLIKNLATSLGVVKAGIHPKLIRLEFSKNSNIDPATLVNTAAKQKIIHRFAGEYEIVLSFDSAEDTLKRGTAFLELLI